MQTLAKNLGKKTCLGVLIVLSLAACTQTNSAPIRDISAGGKPVYQTPVSARPVVEKAAQEENRYTSPPSTIETQQPAAQVVRAPNVQTNTAPVSQSASSEPIQYQRDYQNVPKGGYHGNTYTVKRGDTLFYIAWITGNDFRGLAKRNHIAEPYALSVGQVLDVSGGQNAPASHTVAKQNTAPQTQSTTPVTTPVTTPKAPAKPIFKPSEKPIKPTQSTASKGSTQTLVTETVVTKKPVVTAPKQPVNTQQNVVKAPTETAAQPSTATATVGNITWRWPAKGRIIAPFSSSANGNKGIDIAGSQGQDIQAAASGHVVYAGNALPGYGNLIIIKHNDDYLTAYAHNDKILVQEQQSVKAGQRIATMGKTGTSSTRLHFEIRYKAKSVDPMGYLPR